MESLTGKSPGSTLTSVEWNQLPQEVQNLITDLGIALSNADLDQLGKAMAAFLASGDFYSESGVADAYVLSPIGSKQGPASLIDGLRVRFRPGNANTGSSTVNVNAIGAKIIKREDGSNLQSGDMTTDHDAIIRYDGTDFLLMNYTNSEITIRSRGHISGLLISNGTDAAHDIDITVGECVDSTNSSLMKVTGALTKKIDVDWIAGNDAGGFPSGLTLTASTFYNYFLIKNPTTGVVDAGFDTSSSATNLLSDATGYTQFRQIGIVLTDGTPEILEFFISPDDPSMVNWTDSGGELLNQASSSTAVSKTSSVTPPGTIAVMIVNLKSAKTGGPSGVMQMKLSSLEQTDVAPDDTNASLEINKNVDSTNVVNVRVEVKVDSSSQYRIRNDATDTDFTFDVFTIGFRYARGV